MPKRGELRWSLDEAARLRAEGLTFAEVGARLDVTGDAILYVFRTRGLPTTDARILDEAVVASLHAAGFTPEAVADKLSTRSRTVRAVLRAQGIEPSRKRPKRRVQASDEEIAGRYAAGASATDIAKEIGCSKRTVLVHLHAAGCDVRPANAGSYARRAIRSARTRQGRTLSPLETLASNIARDRGVALELNYAVDRYNIDLADPARKIGIEIDWRGSTTSTVPARIHALHAAGWRIIHVRATTEVLLRRRFAAILDTFWPKP